MEELLGLKVKDNVTGIEGIAVSKCIYMNGCTQYNIQPKLNKDGEVPDDLWVDVQQLKVVSRGLTKAEPKPRGGGNRNHPH